MRRLLIAVLTLLVVLTVIFVVLLAGKLSPVAGQTIPPMQATSTPGGPTPVGTCGPDWCAPPIQTPAWVATPTPQIEPGDGNAPGGPGIVSTPNPAVPLGLPNMAHLHFLPSITLRGR